MPNSPTEGEEEMEEWIGNEGLGKDLCMTCVYWPCLCALTKLEMKIASIREGRPDQEHEQDKDQGGGLMEGCEPGKEGVMTLCEPTRDEEEKLEELEEPVQNHEQDPVGLSHILPWVNEERGVSYTIDIQERCPWGGYTPITPSLQTPHPHIEEEQKGEKRADEDLKSHENFIHPKRGDLGVVMPPPPLLFQPPAPKINLMKNRSRKSRRELQEEEESSSKEGF